MHKMWRIPVFCVLNLVPDSRGNSYIALVVIAIQCIRRLIGSPCRVRKCVPATAISH